MPTERISGAVGVDQFNQLHNWLSDGWEEAILRLGL